MRSLRPLPKRGFTLPEILIVITIIGVLVILVLLNIKKQIDKGHDARRKSDLARISRAFEEYFNDHGCYPPLDILDTCGGDGLAPYMNEIPCDPVTNEPYKYVAVDTSDICKGYRACVSLGDLADGDIERLGCDPIAGCGGGVGEGYNYCVSAGTGPSGDLGSGGVGGPTSTPTPTPTPYYDGDYACTPAGACNSYGNPQASGCPVTYDLPNCTVAGVPQCDNQANRCAQ